MRVGRTPGQMRLKQISVGESGEVVNLSRMAFGRLSSVKFLSLDLISTAIPIDEVVSIEIVLRVAGILPACQEMLVKGVIEAAGVLVMIEYELGESLNIEPWMIVFDPDIVAQNRQLQKRGVLVELEFDVLAPGF